MNSLSNTTDSASVTALVSLGSNLSDSSHSSAQLVLSAIDRLRQISDQSLASSLYRSEPIDCPPGSEDFVNAAMLLRLPSTTSAPALLAILQGIEADFGRRRGTQRNQARTLDLDLISFNNQILKSKDLTLPHPRATQRKFVLMPLAEIDPQCVLPGQTANIAQLLDRLGGQDSVEMIS